jgi:hypothetical protein
MELNEIQKSIMQGKICPYCMSETEFVDSSIIYGKSYGMIYLCRKCDVYCGVHKGTTKALGRIANAELRQLKKEAHKYFDIIWKENHEKRNNVYKYLSEYLEIPLKYTHIGMFSIETCKKVIEWSKMKLNDLRRLDMDFGINVEREHYEL